MPSAKIVWAGETLTLLPERVVWWKREATLFMADPHFGKASAFRFAGIPVPETSHDDLDRLDRVVHRTKARRLVILGDFFHARTGRSEATLSVLAAWRARQPQLKIVLVLGNHDRHAGCPPPGWNIECVEGPWASPPFLCCHEPQEISGSHVLAGHLHPGFHLGERIGSGLSGPCFHLSAGIAVLPAFGSFTGTHRVVPKPADRIFIIGPDAVIDVSKAARKTR